MCENHARKDPSASIDQIFAALAEQAIVTVPGAATVERIGVKHLVIAQVESMICNDLGQAQRRTTVEVSEWIAQKFKDPPTYG